MIMATMVEVEETAESNQIPNLPGKIFNKIHIFIINNRLFCKMKQPISLFISVYF